MKKIRRRPLLWLEALFLIMGVIFFGWPTVKTVRGHAEGNLAITRAEALNNATTWLVQERGQETAEVEWSAAATDQGRYELLLPYLAFAPEKFEDYMNWRYLVVLPKDLKTLAKMELIEGTPMDY